MYCTLVNSRILIVLYSNSTDLPVPYNFRRRYSSNASTVLPHGRFCPALADPVVLKPIPSCSSRSHRAQAVPTVPKPRSSQAPAVLWPCSGRARWRLIRSQSEVTSFAVQWRPECVCVGLELLVCTSDCRAAVRTRDRLWLSWAGQGRAGLGWARLGWAGLGWAGLG